MSARLPLRIGSSDAAADQVTHWQKWAKAYAPAYVAGHGCARLLRLLLGGGVMCIRRSPP